MPYGLGKDERVSSVSEGSKVISRLFLQVRSQPTGPDEKGASLCLTMEDLNVMDCWTQAAKNRRKKTWDDGADSGNDHINLSMCPEAHAK